MALDYRDTIAIPLAQGLDTKTDARALAPPKLLVCDNAVFDEMGGIQKRPGFQSYGLAKLTGGNISAARCRGLVARKDEKLLAAEGKLWSRSDKESAWMDRGRWEPVLVEQETVAVDRTDQVLADRAVAGSVLLVAWEDSKNGGVRYNLYDVVTGAIFPTLNETYVSTATRPMCRSVNGKLHLYWVDTSNNLKVDVIDPDDVYNTAGASFITLASDCTFNEAGASVTGTAGGGGFDVDLFATTHTILAYISTAAGKPVKIGKIDSAGAITIGFVNTTRGARAGMVAVSVDPGATHIALLRMDTTGANDTVKFDWIKVAALADDTNVNIAVASETTAKVMNLTCVCFTGQAAYVFWDVIATSSPKFDVVKRATLTSSAVSATKMFVRRCKLGSRARLWTDSTTERAIVHILHGSVQQSTYFLMDAAFAVGDTNGAVAKGDEVGFLARVLPGEGPGNYVAKRFGHLPQIEDLGSNQFASALLWRRKFQAFAIEAPATVPYSERGIKNLTYAFGDSRLCRHAEEGAAVYLPGGYLAMYDGVRVVESGFLLYTEDITHAQSTGAGALTGGGAIYTYRFYWEWRNAQGETERSTHAGTISVTLAGTENTVTFTVPTLPVTSKSNLSSGGSNVLLAGYRGVAGDADTLYRFTSLDPADASYVLNNPNADSVSVVDLLSDSSLQTGRELDYLNSGQLDNVCPPATSMVAAGQRRLFTRDPEDRTLVRHTKARQDGEAVAGNDSLTISVPQPGGDVTAIQVVENGVLLLKEEMVYAAAGQGPNNFGSNPYPDPQRVSDIGCIDGRSLARTPGRTMFQSKKGIYEIGDSYDVVYIGKEVEAYNSETIAGAFAVPDKHRVHFLMTTTGQLVYDYLLDQWSVWTGVEGISATIWGDAPAYLSTTDVRVAWNTYLDSASSYIFAIETAWIALAGIQNYQRARFLYVLGAQYGDHTLRIRVAYNYDDITGFVDDKSFEFIDRDGDGQIGQCRVGLQKQLCQAFRVRIEDVQNAPSTLQNSVRLSSLGVNVGKRPGPYGLPSLKLG